MCTPPAYGPVSMSIWLCSISATPTNVLLYFSGENPELWRVGGIYGCDYKEAGMCPRWSAVVGIGHHSKVADRHSSPPTTYLAAATDLRLGIKRLEIVTTVRLAVAACRTSSRTRTTALTARKRGHYNLQRAQLLFILSILPVFFQLFLNNAPCSATTIII